MDSRPFTAFQQHINSLFDEFSSDFFNDPFFKTDEWMMRPQQRGEQKRLYAAQPSTQQQQQSSGDQRLMTRPSTSRALRPWNNWGLTPYNNWGLSTQWEQQPTLQCKVDVLEEKDKYIVQADLPGVEKKHIELNIADGYLTVRGERRQQHEDKDEKEGRRWVKREMSYGKVERSIALPRDIDQNKVSAKHEGGVLKVTLPRVPQNQQQGRIAIQ